MTTIEQKDFEGILNDVTVLPRIREHGFVEGILKPLIAGDMQTVTKNWLVVTGNNVNNDIAVSDSTNTPLFRVPAPTMRFKVCPVGEPGNTLSERVARAAARIKTMPRMGEAELNNVLENTDLEPDDELNADIEAAWVAIAERYNLKFEVADDTQVSVQGNETTGGSESDDWVL